MQRKEYNAMEDEFGFNDISEADYNKLRAKEQKKSMPQPQRKKKRKKRIPKEKPNIFRGLGGGSSSRGPINNA